MYAQKQNTVSKLPWIWMHKNKTQYLSYHGYGYTNTKHNI